MLGICRKILRTGFEDLYVNGVMEEESACDMIDCGEVFEHATLNLTHLGRGM